MEPVTTPKILTMRWLTLFQVAVSVVLTVAQPGPGTVTGDTFSHDPTICKDAAGTYYLFCKFNNEVRCANKKLLLLVSTFAPVEIELTGPMLERSSLMVYPGPSHTLVPPTLMGKQTTSMHNLINRNTWAPDCTYRNGQFYVRMMPYCYH